MAKKTGTCRLTGATGKFVKSHLLPLALTKPAKPGNYFIEGGGDSRPKRVHSSWYDESLVTQAGEDVLRDYDTWGIEELRRLKLVWSGWGPMLVLSAPDWQKFPHTRPEFSLTGIRFVVSRDTNRFRLFFLSLLWRAAATNLSAFNSIKLDDAELALLGDILLGKKPAPPTFYPVSLLQIDSIGARHNFVPIVQESQSDDGQGGTLYWSTYRFYFDGLIMQFHRPQPGQDREEFSTSDFMVGMSSRIAVQTQAAEHSFQYHNLSKLRAEAALQWPTTIEKLGGGARAADREFGLRLYEAAYGKDLPWTKVKE